jgi:ribonucleotide reductase beta subunit family protein with ferritin-like domain
VPLSAGFPMPKNLVWFNSMSNLSPQHQTMILDEHIWCTGYKNKKIERWLNNFQEEEKDMAHKLLNHFVYFNNRMIKEMLISLYRDFIQYPIRQKFLHEVDVEKLFKEELNQTRFLGMGIFL